MTDIIQIDKSLYITLKHNCLIITQSTNTGSNVYSFDLVGRLWTAMQNNISYRQGLDGKIIAKWIDEKNNRHRKWLPNTETVDLLMQTREILATCIARLEFLLASDEQQAQNFHQIYLTLLKIKTYDTLARETDIEYFHTVYKPVGILPPDQYMAVLLQATEGCSFNSCTFCTFYKDQKFKIKSLLEFTEHVLEVKAFLGEGLSLRRTIFLGGANALVIPIAHLVQLLEIVNDNFNVEELGGIYAFLDGFAGEKKTVDNYRNLSKLGLKRIYIGLESGSDDLLYYLHKPGNARSALTTVKHIKEAGIAVGVIVLLGAGGKQYSHQHVSETIKVLNEMPLDLDDIVYFSELVELEKMDYLKTAYDNSLEPLSLQEIIKQQELIEQNLIFNKNGTPHISRYDVREFVY